MNTKDQISIGINSFRVVILVFFVLGLIVGVLGWKSDRQSIPHCSNALDMIVGNGEYNQSTGYWSEYNCVSDWRDAARISIKRGAK